MGVKVGRRKEQTVEFKPDEDGDIIPSPETNEFLNKLRSLELAIYFLSDDRSVRFAGVSGLDPSDYVDEEIFFTTDLQSHRSHLRRRQSIEERSDLLLRQSIHRSEQWLQSQAVRGASEGESSVNALYGEILEQISSISLSSENTDSSKVNAIFNRIEGLEARSGDFAKYGLAPSFQGKDIVQAIKRSQGNNVDIVTTVIEHYIEKRGAQARRNAESPEADRHLGGSYEFILS